ncbi:PAP-specific phosphatase HAL2-like [Hibiscus syriacus]|uniref:PAP-specific phosphatase HAL2-like n=1 Tax=Hibiscus syriacus TaxID=106335 RepID=A0A6A2Z336_HIBSY|nr:keratin, type II cytoskeletal 2 epidermal-like [Hibiscus syriacus]KAE8686278.1 PAP-specific phosphatase HAL2-like [Hibiscus syriacus]
MMNPKSTFILTILLIISASLSAATRPDHFEPLSSSSQQKQNKGSKTSDQNNNNNGGIGGLFGPGSAGFGIPGWGNGIIGGGYGAGVGGPNGGYSKGGVIRPSVVCKENGPCFNKKLTCPAKCFDSFSRSGKGYGAGGGGGSCTMDCKKKCIAYC